MDGSSKVIEVEEDVRLLDLELIQQKGGRNNEMRMKIKLSFFSPLCTL